MSNSTLSPASAESPWLIWLLESVADVLALPGAWSLSLSVAHMAATHSLRVEAVEAWLAASSRLVPIAAAAFAPTDTALEEERMCVHQAIRAAQPILQFRLQLRLAQADAAAITIACQSCRTPLSPHERRDRSWLSVTGNLSLKRQYFYCSECKSGICPSERIVGLPGSKFTPYVEERCTRMATILPHRQAMTEVGEQFGLEVGVTTIEAMTERRAIVTQEIQRQEAKACAPYDERGLPRASSLPTIGSVPTKAPDVAYVELDGVIPMTRERTDNAKTVSDDAVPVGTAVGTQRRRGGAGRTYTMVGREVKNAVLYEESHCAAESASRGCITDKRYVSHLGDWRAFANLLWVQVVRMRFNEARLLVVLSDGAEWVRSLADWLPIPVRLILDLYHAKHRVWEVANAVFGERTVEARAWAHKQNEHIEAGQTLAVIEALGQLRSGSESEQKMVRELTTYLSNNLDRMDYPAYRAMGLRVTTAAVESCNYHVIGQRLKCQGMRWGEAGAGEMSTLRADYCNGAWNQRTRQILDFAA